MKSEDFIQGIQFAINMFEPMVARHKQMLDQAARHTGPVDPVLLNTTRVEFRCFAEVVGGLKLRRDQFSGTEPTDRMATHDRYAELRYKAVEEWKSPLTKGEAEATERQADTCLAAFALSWDGKLPDDLGSAEPVLPATSGLVH